MKTLSKILKNVKSNVSVCHFYSFGFLAFSLAASVFFNSNSALTEQIYYRLIYSNFRWLWDHSFSFLPLPVIYIWLAFVFTYTFYSFYQYFKNKVKYTKLIINLLCFISLHICWFYWAWGYNYNRIQLGIRWNLYSDITENEFIEALKEQTQLVGTLRIADSIILDAPMQNPLALESEVRKLINNFQESHGFLSFSGIRCRDLKPSGFLLIWAASGVYLPFCSESQIDAGLSVYSKPFTIAHELSHGMGWTHEGDCNLIAYLACRNSKNPYIRYCAELNYWRYLLSHASRNFSEIYNQTISQIPLKVKSDLLSIHEANNRYPEFLPNFRNWFYEWYLIKNGIQSGQKSYTELIPMLINYKKKNQEDFYNE